MKTQLKKTILYVDDEQNNLVLFDACFRRTYNVITALSPHEALDKLEAHGQEISIVISDMRMNEMNGIEFIQKAKNQYNNKHYFIMTGFTFDPEIQDALDHHLIEDKFSKPFDIHEVESALEPLEV